MKIIKNITLFLCVVLIGISVSGFHNRILAKENIDITYNADSVSESDVTPQKELSQDSIIASSVYATGYYCIYDCEMDSSQTISLTISNHNYNLKASFLYGGYGIAMQGTGRTGPDGDYIKYTGGGGCFVYISGPNAGKNLSGKWEVKPQTLRKRYAQMGVTDFTGFGNLALANPEKAEFSNSSGICGSSGNLLKPWHSIAAAPSLLDSGQYCTILFKDGSTTPCSDTLATFKAEDTGGNIKGRHIDIYVGEGQAAWNQWLKTGGNRYVDIYIAD